MLRIYGITYGDKKTEFIEYKNRFTANLHRFEYNPMMDIVDNMITDMDDETDYLGIFSWKFKQKVGLTQAQIIERMKHAPKADVYNLSPFLGWNIAGCGCFMDWSAMGHGELLRELIKRCCEKSPYGEKMKYENNPLHVIYANQFIAKPTIYWNYINSVVKPALKLLEGDLWETVNVNANYSAGIKQAELKRNTGLDFYNYVPFVLERMFMQYVHNLNLKTVSLVW